MRLFERLNAQAGFALVLIVFATVYASQIPELGMPFADAQEPGASFFPLVLVTVLYVAAIRVLIAELRGTGDGEELPTHASDTVPRIGLIGPLALIGLTALFVLALPRLGYFLSAALYTFGVALFFNYEETGGLARAALKAALTAAAITGFGWVFFEGIFDLSLPAWDL